MIFFVLLSTLYCQNIIKNPSFEEVENYKPLHWYLDEGVELSSESHLGKNSLYWKPTNRAIFSYQMITIEKGFQYEMCVHLKLRNIPNITKEGFLFMIQSVKKENEPQEYFYSRYYNGNSDWKKACHLTGIIKKRNDSDLYYFGLYSPALKNSSGEIFVDDISIRRINFKIGINNDRDEVYDNINVVFQINGYKENYNLSDFELITRIKDDTKTYYDNKIEIDSFFFTKKINIKELELMDNNFYKVESILKNKKDNVTDIFSYPFKKINKIQRKVTIDEYGRIFVNDELFFPFGIYLIDVKESDLMLINKTHLNFILPYGLIGKTIMDMIYSTQQGKLKVIYSLQTLYKLDYNKCSNLKDEDESYKQFIDKINEFKEYPNLLSWYIDDEMPFCYNKFLRNRTLSVHQLDPNHPSFTVLCYPGETNQLINTTDIMGFDNYPIGRAEIRDVLYFNDDAYKETLKSKPYIPVIQIFDWAHSFWNKRQSPDFKSCPPTLQEMRSMSWQGLVAGGKGLLFFSLWQVIEMDEITPFEKRWNDVIEFTDEIWKYKDVILSIDEVNKIEYENNYNVEFKQWKYNKTNYIVIVNLERKKEIFKINLLDKYNINKEFGLGKYKKNGTEIIFDLEPIDVIMITYSKGSESKSNSNLLVIFLVIIIIIIVIGVLAFFTLKYLRNKYKTKSFVESVSKLMNDEN